MLSESANSNAYMQHITRETINRFASTCTAFETLIVSGTLAGGLDSIAPLPLLTSSLPNHPLLPSKAQYPSVKFWTKQDFDESTKKQQGETNGLATAKKKWGHPSKAEESEAHPYLQTVHGNSVSQESLWLLSMKACKVWQVLWEK